MASEQIKGSSSTTIEVGLTFHFRPAGPSTGSLWVVGRSSSRYLLKRWDFPSGRPEPAQLSDLCAALVDEVNTSVVTSVGVQGVINGV